jgi:hypothetical protein
MTTDTTIPSSGVRNRVERTGPAIRAALTPERRAAFEADFHTAAVEADDTCDLAPLRAVLDRWWPWAVLDANPEIQTGAVADQRRPRSPDAESSASIMARVIVMVVGP